MSHPNIVLVGCGNMGGAMLSGWLRQGIAAERITVIDPSLPALPDGVRRVAEPEAAMDVPAALILAVKPQKLAEVAGAISALAAPQTLLLSVLASAEIATLRRVFPRAGAIVRAVPNLPAAIGHGITALAGEGLSPSHVSLAETLCAPLGPVEWLAREALCDAATSVSGCGPAFLFRFADAVARAGEAQGLPRAQALRLIAETMAGAGAMLRAADADPAEMAARVASPGGVTLAGLRVLDEQDALTRLIADTLAAAAARSAEMAAETRDAVQG
ncbi:pyrroline-5-carboxylate reductase [Sphingomonas quercus]|uniref:Pyrroline-5-carboxylate reductase n=1 Tax=Sphingomonas quercus TaxID=2842451 RepID=A0ABS6BL33_9SPHN|nr:pyrroline-5-carboxylate reductase [Sphingomonas quercus]MBU3078537.1 pyrroline-5-carboxylate reductase [Sphingomonas quercus]